MNAERLNTYTRSGALTAILGTVIMLTGAALWGTSGTDLWQTLDGGSMKEYLETAGTVKSQLAANLTLWIIGVIIIGISGRIMVDLCGEHNALARAAQVCLNTGIPLAVVSYIAMFSIVIYIAPDSSEQALSIAGVIGWIGARTDDLATALIIGAMPFFISLAGRNNWVPNWLVKWGYFAGLSGVFSIAVLYLPVSSQTGFIILPIGMGWLISAGIVLLKRKSV